MIERETKTKAYSKEGLTAAGKVDPHERQKDEILSWVSVSCCLSGCASVYVDACMGGCMCCYLCYCLYGCLASEVWSLLSWLLCCISSVRVRVA